MLLDELRDITASCDATLLRSCNAVRHRQLPALATVLAAAGCT